MSTRQNNLMLLTYRLLIICVIIFMGFARMLDAAEFTIDNLRAERAVISAKKRVIFNNDGCDAFQVFPKHWDVSPEHLLKLRTTPLKNSDVTTISYCTISSSFGQFTHRTKIGEILTMTSPAAKKRKKKNIVSELIAQGTDPLEIMVDYAKQNNFEIFWSMRMNDTHDFVHKPKKPYYRWSKLKEKHPEYLIGSVQEKLKCGRWSAVDYAKPEIRELAFRYIEEVCENYDIDGIELDFFRHLFLFRSVALGGKASPEELNMMTKLMQRIRKMTERVGMKRGRPILISIRVPDSAEYCKGVGIDLETWCKEKLIDVVIGSGYFRLNSWGTLVEFGKQNNISFIAGISDPRVSKESKDFRRKTDETYLARAADAWQSGVNGLYIFNEYYPAKAKYLKEIGSLEKLKLLDKKYFVNYLDGNPDTYLNDGRSFIGKSWVVPRTPRLLGLNKKESISIYIGDDFSALASGGTKTPVTFGHVRIPKLSSDYDIEIKVNQHEITDKRYIIPWLHFQIDPVFLLPGKNDISFMLKEKKAGNKNKVWDVEYICNKKLKYPSQLPWRRLFKCSSYKEEIRDKTLYMADLGGSSSNDMFNLIYPWSVDPDELITVETSLKVEDTDDPLAVSLRLANGRNCEFLTFEKNQIGLKFADINYQLDTVEDYHLYRIELQKNDIKVYVDGKLAIDGTGKYVTDALAPSSRLELAMGNNDYWNKRSLMMGSASGLGTGSAYWKYIRFHSVAKSIEDLAVTVNFVDNSENIDAWDLVTGNMLDKSLIKNSPGVRYPWTVKQKIDFTKKYDPCSGFLPDSASTHPKWRNLSYNSNTAKIIDDATLEKKVLFLDNNGTGKEKYACYILNMTKEEEQQELMIIDFELKLLGQSAETPQFSLSVSKRMPDKKFVNCSFRFAKDWIYSHSNREGLYTNIKLDNKWHKYRVIIDFKKKVSEIHLDGSKQPLVVAPCYVRSRGRSMIKFGDGSGAIEGISLLSFFNWMYIEGDMLQTKR